MRHSRNNPLLVTPPVAPSVAHRLGEQTTADVQDMFTEVDDDVEDLYAGVHVTPHPIVATAYALARRALGENDYGLVDIVDPPVLIGLRVRASEERLDADGYVTAKHIHEKAAQLVDDEITPGEVSNHYDELAEDYALADYTRSEMYFEPYLGLAYAGGMIGNQPDYVDFVTAVRAHMVKINEGHDEEELLRHALAAAKRIVPQSRIMREMTEADVAALVVLPAYVAPDGTHEASEHEGAPFVELDAYEGFETAEEFDDQLLHEGTAVWGDPAAANRWHGTSLSIARKALPDIVTSDVFADALEAGSAYDSEELAAEYEDEDEDEDEDDFVRENPAPLRMAQVADIMDAVGVPTRKRAAFMRALQDEWEEHGDTLPLEDIVQIVVDHTLS